MKTGLVLLGLLPTVGKVGYDNLPNLPSRKGVPGLDKTPGDGLSSQHRLRNAGSASRLRLLDLLQHQEKAGEDDLPHLPASVPAPQKPSVANPPVLERFAYSKGDQAKTIEEFKQALAGDYIVSFNDNAKDPEKFPHRITVYGENHLVPNLPSIPGGRGIALFEAHDPERCIQKYRLHDTNLCSSIDDPDLSSESMAFDRLKAAYYDVLNEVGPHAIDDVESQLSERATTQEFMLKSLTYIGPRMREIDASGDQARVNRIMDKMSAAADISAQSRAQIESRISVRDDHMFEKSTANIQHLPADEAATIVVGDAHADKLFARLAQAFPERAVVKCKVALLNAG